MPRAIGFWITDIFDRTRPAPQELVGSLPADRRGALAEYLAHGVSRAEYFGNSWCRFGCEIADVDLGYRDLTDGTWVWPEGLAHYVRDHGIILPDEFIDHALTREPPNRQGLPDADRVADPRSLPPLDEEYWAGWCASRRSPEFLTRLEESRQAAESLAIADRADRLAALIGEHGLSSARCQWRNCSHHALAETYICAEHQLSHESADPLGRAAHALHEALAALSGALGVRADFNRPKPAPARADSFSVRLKRALGRAVAFGRPRAARRWRD